MPSIVTKGSKSKAAEDARGEKAEENEDGEKAWPMTNISEPGNNDCLFGRGGHTTWHPGNKLYRQMIDDKKSIYAASKRQEKTLIAMEIVNEWRGLTPPGRFLEQDKSTKLWSDVGDGRAKEKASQALRERHVPDVIPDGTLPMEGGDEKKPAGGNGKKGGDEKKPAAAGGSSKSNNGKRGDVASDALKLVPFAHPSLPSSFLTHFAKYDPDHHPEGLEDIARCNLCGKDISIKCARSTFMCTAASCTCTNGLKNHLECMHPAENDVLLGVEPPTPEKLEAQKRARAAVGYVHPSDAKAKARADAGYVHPMLDKGEDGMNEARGENQEVGAKTKNGGKGNEKAKIQLAKNQEAAAKKAKRDTKKQKKKKAKTKNQVPDYTNYQLPKKTKKELDDDEVFSMAVEAHRLREANSQAVANDFVKLTLTLPKGDQKLGLVLQDDKHDGLPVLMALTPESPFHSVIPPHLIKKYWIVGLKDKHVGEVTIPNCKVLQEELKKRRRYVEETWVEFTFAPRNVLEHLGQRTQFSRSLLGMPQQQLMTQQMALQQIQQQFFLQQQLMMQQGQLPKPASLPRKKKPSNPAAWANGCNENEADIKERTRDETVRRALSEFFAEGETRPLEQFCMEYSKLYPVISGEVRNSLGLSELQDKREPGEAFTREDSRAALNHINAIYSSTYSKKRKNAETDPAEARKKRFPPLELQGTCLGLQVNALDLCDKVDLSNFRGWRHKDCLFVAKLDENERCVKCRYAIKKLLDKQTKLALAGALPEEEAVEKTKKPASAYMLFSKEMRPTVVEENPDMSFGEVGRELGARWRALSDDEKAKYKKKPE